MKKDFKAVNPALAYISGGQEEETECQAVKVPAPAKPGKSRRAIKRQAPAPAAGATETRSKRLQALITPSLFRKMAKYAKKNKVSRNEVVMMALSAFLDDEREE